MNRTAADVVSRAMKTLFAGASALLLSSCVTHAAFGPVPDGHASLAERADAYDRLKPAAVGPWPAAPAPSGLVLSDGTVVVDPTDLGALVGDDSATMAHARAAADNETLGSVLDVVGTVGVSVGVALTTTASLIATTTEVPRGDDQFALPLLVGGGVLTTGGLAALIPGVLIGTRSTQERMAAFASFDRDLRSKLRLKATPKALSDQWQPDAE